MSKIVSFATEARIGRLFLAAHPGWKLFRLPKFSSADFILSREEEGEMVGKGLVEVKSDGCASTKHPHVQIPMEKWLRLVSFSRNTGMFIGVAVEFEDGLFFYRHRPENVSQYKVVQHRGVVESEWSVHIPVSLLKRVNGSRAKSPEVSSGSVSV